MKDLALDTLTHDLRISVFDLGLVEQVDRVAQQVKIRLLFFLGEWFLDTRAGIPYYRDILIKNPIREIVEGIFRDAILTTPDVISLDRFSIEYDGVTRNASVDFRATTTFGALEFNDLLEVTV